MHQEMYYSIAGSISAETPYLQCATCRKKIVITRSGVVDRLRNGWEKCCGFTMTYYPGVERDTENDVW